MRSKTPLVVVLAALLILLLIVVIGVTYRIRLLTAQLPSVIRNELQTRLGREVRIRSVSVPSSQTVILQGIDIANGKTFANGTLASAGRVVVTVGLLDVVLGRVSVLRGLSSVTIEDPAVHLIRAQSGALNVADLLKPPPTPPSQRFQGLIRVMDGNLDLTDYAAKLPRVPAVNGLGGINGYLDFSHPGYLISDLSASGTSRRLGNMRLTGQWGTGQQTGLRLAVNRADAGYWLNYVANIQSWKVNGGRLSATAVIDRDSRGEVRERGTAYVSQAEMTSPHLFMPVQSVNGTVAFVGRNLGITVRGLLGRSPLLLRGTVSGFAPSRVNLVATSDRLDLGTLQTAVPAIPRPPRTSWTAPATAAATITGIAPNLVVVGTLRTPRAVIYGVPTTDLSASGDYRASTIRVLRAVGRAGGGSLSLTAQIGLQAHTSVVQGSATGVRMDQVSIPSLPPVYGIADADFHVDFQRGFRGATIDAALRSARVDDLRAGRATVRMAFTGPRSGQGTISLTDGSLSGMPIRTANADLSLADGSLTVRSLTAEAFRGRMTASGVIALRGPVSLRVSARGIDLAMPATAMHTQGISGTGNIQGQVTGTTQNPMLTADLVATNGRIRQAAYDRVSGRVVASRGRLVLRNPEVRRGTSLLVAAGTITIPTGAQPQFDISVRGEQLDIAELAGLLNLKVKASGLLSAALQVRGAYPNIRASGDVTATNVVVANTSIDLARISLTTQGERTVITQLFAQHGAMRLTGSGSVGPRGRVSIEVLGTNLDMDILNRTLYPYVVLGGPVAFSGTVRGTLSEPTIAGTASSSAPTINGQRFDSLTAGLTWSKGVLAMNDASLLSPMARFQVPRLAFDTANKTIEARASLGAASIAGMVELLRGSPLAGLAQGERLRQFLASLPRPFAGAVDASLALTGPIGAANGSASLTASGVQMGTAQVTRARMEFTAAGRRFDLQSASIGSPGVSFTASASFLNAEPTAFSAALRDTQIPSLVNVLTNAPVISMYPFGIRLLSAIQSIPQPATGRLNASISLADLQTGPTGSLAVEASDLSLAGAQFGQAVVEARLSGGSVFLDRLQVNPPTGVLSASGTIDPEGLLSISGTASALPLSLAKPWVEREIVGTLSAQFTATGTASDPQVQTSLSLTGVRLGRFSIDSVATDRVLIAGGRLSSDRITLTNVSTELVVSGSVPFAWERPFIPPDQPIMMHASLSDQTLATLKSSIPMVENAGGTLAASLDVSGTVNDPVLNGRFDLANGSLKLRGFDNEFTGLVLRARFEGSDFIIDTLTGQSSLGGRFIGGGSARLTSLSTGNLTVFLTLDALKLSITNLTGIYGERLRFTANGQLVATDTLQAPSIQGQVVVSDARLQVPATPIPTTAKIPVLPVNPKLDVTINLARGVVIERGALTAEVVGPMTLTGTASSPSLIGTVQITSGRLRYVGRSLNFIPGGTASFLFQPPRPAVISVNVSASTRVTLASPLTGRATRYTIAMDISGTVDHPDISVRSSPPGLTNIQALTSIFGGAPIEALTRGLPPEEVIREGLGAILLGIAVPQLLQPLAVGPFTFALEPGFDIPLQVTASAALSEKVILSYSRSVAGRLPIDTVAFSYTIDPRFAVTIQFEGQNGSARDTVYLIQYFTRF